MVLNGSYFGYLYYKYKVLKYRHCRCYVPECEDPLYSDYEQPWLQLAVPPKTTGMMSDTYEPSQCERYMPVNMSGNYLNHICTPDMFTAEVIRCNKWVFDDDRTIVTDVSHVYYVTFVIRY